jgi:hypothetical protein
MSRIRNRLSSNTGFLGRATLWTLEFRNSCLLQLSWYERNRCARKRAILRAFRTSWLSHVIAHWLRHTYTGPFLWFCCFCGWFFLYFRSRIHTGERNLAGETVLVDIFQDVLTLDYHQERLSRYSVEWQPDDRHLARVGYPRLYQHRYQSSQLELWQPGEVEWFVIIRDWAPVRRRRGRSRIVVIQPSLPFDGTQG